MTFEVLSHCVLSSLHKMSASFFWEFFYCVAKHSTGHSGAVAFKEFHKEMLIPFAHLS